MQNGLVMGSISDVTIVWAEDADDGQVKGFIVPTTTPGYLGTRIENKQAPRIVQNADIVLENVVVPEVSRLQNSTSFRGAAAVLRLTRAEVAWAAVGNSVGAYDAAVKYAGERIQFGKEIGGRQRIQDLLAKSLGNITASIGMVTRVSEMLDEGTKKTSTPPSRRTIRPAGYGRPSPGAANSSEATASFSTTTSSGSLRIPKPSTPMRALVK